MFHVIAVKDSETVKWEQSSELFALAKARVWASEGWKVEVTDDDGQKLSASEFEQPA